MIVITTPTGQIGSGVVARMLDGGVPIRVVVRDPSRLDPRVAEQVEVIQGPHDDVDVLDAALVDADAVFLVVPPDPHAVSPRRHYENFARATGEAVMSQKVERVVAVSSLGRGFGRDAGLLSAAFAMDDVIEWTGAHYRALRMPFYMENLLAQAATIRSDGLFSMVNSDDHPLTTVATRDIADVAAGLLLDLGWSGQDSVAVIGPDRLSPAGMADVMTEVLGYPVRFEHADTEAYRTRMLDHGMSEGWAHGLIAMAVAQNDGVYDDEDFATRATDAAAPTDFRRWCHDVLAPAAARLSRPNGSS